MKYKAKDHTGQAHLYLVSSTYLTMEPSIKLLSVSSKPTVEIQCMWYLTRKILLASLMRSQDISSMCLFWSCQKPGCRLPARATGCLVYQASVLSHYQKGGRKRSKCLGHSTVCPNAAVCKLNLKCRLQLQFLSFLPYHAVIPALSATSE